MSFNQFINLPSVDVGGNVEMGMSNILKYFPIDFKKKSCNEFLKHVRETKPKKKNMSSRVNR